MTKKIHFSKLRNWHAFATPILEKFGTKPLLDYPKKFKEFWEEYAKTYQDRPKSGYDFKNPNFRKKVVKRLLNLKGKQKKKRQTSVELHENYIKFHVETRLKQRTKKKEKLAAINEADNLEIISKKVEKKKITEISFASEITVSTVNRIATETQFLEEFAKDYLDQVTSYQQVILHNTPYVEDKKTASDQEAVDSPNDFKQETLGEKLSALDSSFELCDELKKGVANSPKVSLIERNHLGGVGGRASSRKTFHFQHLALSNQLRQKLQDIANDLTTKILECNPRELQDMNRRLDTITKLIDTTRKLDLQPIYMINQIAEGGFNRQKELQGAVVNDKAMIDNGQIVLEKVKEEEQVTSEDIEKDLKKLGTALLLDTANNFSEESKTIDQVKEAEFSEVDNEDS